ncbi:hypothetical protein ABI59_08765 [Acidobacteria bacterium Mor1]|nr:hypothetical protein ABI59_08765 [Acidobacteria bacterium Mor1]
MNEQTTVYDLGDISSAAKPRQAPRRPVTTQPTAAPPPRAAPIPGKNPAHSQRWQALQPGAATAGTLSLFLPGAGQALLGRPKLGLFFVSLLGLFVCCGWAVLATLERLNDTAALLGAPRSLASWILVVLFAAGAATHLAAVLHAHDLGEARRGRSRPWPVVSMIASLLIPGWGQVLNGDRIRAVLFLGGLWHLAGAWIVVLPVLRYLIESPMVPVRPLLLGPVLLACSTCVLWILATYDAAAGATMRRLER